jgi:hypothetical protein
MKLIRTTTNKLRFRLSPREKDLLLAVLRLYPCIPTAYQPLTRLARLGDSNQQLLDEALAEQRASNKKHLQVLLADPKTLTKTKTGWELSLSPADVEWLLQVLNDIRVGSWTILGSPEDCTAPLNAANVSHLWAMKIAGAFEMEILEAWEGGG